MYGGRAFESADGSVRVERQALHAVLLAFEHPLLGTPLVMVSPPREEVARLIECLRVEGRVIPVHVGGTVALGRFGLNAPLQGA